MGLGLLNPLDLPRILARIPQLVSNKCLLTPACKPGPGLPTNTYLAFVTVAGKTQPPVGCVPWATFLHPKVDILLRVDEKECGHMIGHQSVSEGCLATWYVTRTYLTHKNALSYRLDPNNTVDQG
jgi:hypothetical protein